MSRHTLALASLGLASALAAGCGPEPAPSPARVRLWVDLPAELVEAPEPPAAELVFASDFAADLASWAPVVNPGRDDGALEARPVADEERTVLLLTGAHGGLHRVLPVEPDTTYVFSGSVRADGIDCDRPELDGARFWLAEASDEAPSFQAFRTSERALLTADWASPSAHGHPGWRPVRHVFVTRPKTKFLHVLCALATTANVRSGSVRFADLRLERLEPPRAWRERLASENALRRQIDPMPAGAHAARRVSAELGGEDRPGIVLFPGERLRFPLPALPEPAELVLGVATWPPVRAAWRQEGALGRPISLGVDDGGSPGRTVVRVRADAEELLSAELAVPSDPVSERWRELAARLPAGAAALEVAAEGTVPVVLGAPLVRAARSAAMRPNLLLVSIDTLRADRVGAYGRADALTPTLDGLARAGLLCRDASAPAPYTLPSHATLLTGQFPSVHGVLAHENFVSRARSTGLAELLGRAGYATRAFTAGGFVDSVFGLDQGFEAFSEVDPVRADDSHYFRTLVSRHGKEQAARLLDEQGFAGVERWLRAASSRAEPFFLFLHTYAVHDYDAPRAYLPCDSLGCARPKVALRTDDEAQAAAFTPEMRAHVQHLYAAALRYTDERLGALLALLAELGVRERTLVVVTSDHGEEFFEHGALQHGRTLYEELLRVPLVFQGPGIAPGELARPAMLSDVVPTVLARLGLPRPEHVQGVDLLGPAWPARAVWSEVDSRFARKYALRAEDGRKTIHGPETRARQRPNERAWELYELAHDPAERSDLASEAGPRLERAQDELRRHLAALEELGRALGNAGAGGELDAGTLTELDQLGYGGE